MKESVTVCNKETVKKSLVRTAAVVCVPSC